MGGHTCHFYYVNKTGASATIKTVQVNGKDVPPYTNYLGAGKDPLKIGNNAEVQNKACPLANQFRSFININGVDLPYTNATLNSIMENPLKLVPLGSDGKYALVGLFSDDGQGDALKNLPSGKDTYAALVSKYSRPPPVTGGYFYAVMVAVPDKTPANLAQVPAQLAWAPSSPSPSAGAGRKLSTGAVVGIVIAAVVVVAAVVTAVVVMTKKKSAARGPV